MSPYREPDEAGALLEENESLRAERNALQLQLLLGAVKTKPTASKSTRIWRLLGIAATFPIALGYLEGKVSASLFVGLITIVVIADIK